MDYNCDLSIVETPSYTRENISDRSYTDSNAEGVPTNQRNIAKLYVCDPIAVKTKTNTIKQTILQLKARRRRKNGGFSLRAYPIAPPTPGGGGVSNFYPVKALIRVFYPVKVLWSTPVL